MLSAVGAGSLLVWVNLAAQWRRRGFLLEYQPRQAVPWGPAAALLAIIFVLMALAPSPADNKALPPELPPLPDPQLPLDAIGRLVQLIFAPVIVVGGFVFVVALFSRATLHDLGLPTYADELPRDTALGIATCLAALPIVYGVLAVVSIFIEEPSQHPMIELIRQQPHPAVFVLAAISAVIIAPICEELTFRLLLQGWLEKWEVGANVEARMTNDEDVQSSFVIRHSSFLPHGWLPIVLSSGLFALAHYGHGAAPVALFFLAVALGYTYQRTHRIIPCIVAHSVFNLLTIVTLWRTVLRGAE
jgi:membrane protease YdiL (CAAX protease family)